MGRFPVVFLQSAVARAAASLLALLLLAACDRRLETWETTYALKAGGHCAVLVGSTHIGPASFEKPSSGLKSLFDKSDVLALELDLGRLTSDVRARFATQDPADRLGSLPEKMQADVQRALDTVKLMRPVDRAEVPTVHLTAVLRTIQASNAFPFEPKLAPSLDSYFFLAAKAAGKKVEEVEGLDAWIASERSMPRPMLERQIAVFSSRAVDAGVAAALNAFLGRTFEIMKMGDLDELYRAHHEFFEGELRIPNYTAHEIDARNAHMADRMAQLLSEYTNTFAIIGALHLPGPKGVIARLQRRGVTAVRISSADEAPPCSAKPQ